MYYTIALTFASILIGQTRWSEAHSENTFKDPENLPRPLARKLPLGLWARRSGRPCARRSGRRARDCFMSSNGTFEACPSWICPRGRGQVAVFYAPWEAQRFRLRQPQGLAGHRQVR
jgi:hypothetical protein